MELSVPTGEEQRSEECDFLIVPEEELCTGSHDVETLED
jgi:hypothetical protein